MNRYIICSALLACASPLVHGAAKDFDSLGSSTSAGALFQFGGPAVDEIGDLVEGALTGGQSHAGDALIYSNQDASGIKESLSFNLYTNTIIPVQIESVTKTFTLKHGFNVLNWSLDDGNNGSVLGGVTLGSSFYWTVGILDSDPNISKFAMGMTQSAASIGSFDDPTKMYIDFGTGLEGVTPTPTGYIGPMGRVEVLATPEPSSVAFLGLGVVGLFIRRRKK